MVALKDDYALDQLEHQARLTLRFMEKKGLAKSIAGARYFYLVTAPYASSKELNPYELVMEAYYDGVLAYATAMQLHQLTDQRFKTFHILVPTSQLEDGKPLDVAAVDALLFGPPTRLKVFDDYEVDPHKVKSESVFGYEIIKPDGFSLRVTDLERTLIDGFRYPRHCGGLDEVFRGWVRAYDLIDLDKLTRYVEQFNVGILYQRAGFVLEALKLEHPCLNRWQAEHVQRGGSRVLDPESPFSGQRISERWGLSINHSTSILDAMDASYS